MGGAINMVAGASRAYRAARLALGSKIRAVKLISAAIAASGVAKVARRATPPSASLPASAARCLSFSERWAWRMAFSAFALRGEMALRHMSNMKAACASWGVATASAFTRWAAQHPVTLRGMALNHWLPPLPSLAGVNHSAGVTLGTDDVVVSNVTRRRRAKLDAGAARSHGALDAVRGSSQHCWRLAAALLRLEARLRCGGSAWTLDILNVRSPSPCSASFAVHLSYVLRRRSAAASPRAAMPSRAALCCIFPLRV